MKNKMLLTILAVFICTGLMYAETAEDILNKSIKAAGGSAKYEAIKSLKISGKMNMMGMELPFTNYMKKPAFRMEQEVMGQKVITAFDGTKGWMINPMGGSSEAQEMPEEILAATKRNSNMGQNPIMTLKEEGITATLEGKEKVDGKENYKIKMVNKQNEVSYLFIDATTNLITKTTAEADVMGQKTNVEMFFKEYKEFGGIKMVTLAEMNASGQTITIRFDNYEINGNIDDSIFKMPK